MADLSAAANAFSVVGLADIVFHLGVSTASLYARYRNASKDIASLVDEIQAFVETVTQIRLYLDEYQQSNYVQNDRQTPPPQLAKALSDCETELRKLKRFADDNGSKPDDGLAIQMLKRWRWASQQDHVLKSHERIRHLNVKLQPCLMLIGRKNEIVLRNELKSTRTDINTVGLTVRQAFNSLEGNLTTSQENIKTLVQSQTGLISQVIKHSDDHHLSLESNINSKHEKTNALVLSQTTLINHMIKMTEDHHQQLLERIPSLTLEQTDDDDFIFQGDNLGSIVFPLLLMKSPLFKTIKTLQKEGVLRISCSETDWILQQFEGLLARGHEAAARDLNGKTMNQRNDSLEHEHEKVVADQKVFTFDQIGRMIHTSTISTSSGVLILQSGLSNKHLKRCQDAAEIQVFRLSFFPKAEFSSINISMLMTNEFGRNMQLQIPRLIQTYKTIPYPSEILELIVADDSRGLEMIFRTGRGSPNDFFEKGFSLSQVAALTQRISVCGFLFRAGASASMFSPSMSDGNSYSVLYSIWHSLNLRKLGTCYQTGLRGVDNAIHLSNLAIKHGCDPNMVSFPFQQNIMQVFIWSQRYDKERAEHVKKHPPGPCNCADLLVDKFCDIFSSMVGMGCELEGPDYMCQTALHWACFLLEPNMIIALIDIGADLSATDDHGNGVLHLLFFADQLGYDYEKHYFENNLYRGLAFLLANKADPNHLNDFGESPSDFAFGRPARLDVWNKAIEHAGYKILTIRIKFAGCDCGERIADGHEITRSVIVSAGFELLGDNDTLPISNMTLDEWMKEKKAKILRRRMCRVETLPDPVTVT